MAIQFFVCNFPLAFFRRSTNSFTHMHAQAQAHRHNTWTYVHTHTHSHFLFHFSLCLCATVQQSFLRRKFISACARFTWSVHVCACVYAQQSLANFVGFIYAQCATALHTSWRSRRTEMNFHGNFTKTNPLNPQFTYPSTYFPFGSSPYRF